MDTLDDTVTPRVPDGSCQRFDSIALKELLKLLASKFSSIVVDGLGWPRVVTEPFAVEGQGDGLAGFVVDGDKLGPPSGFIHYGEGLDFFDGGFTWDGSGIVSDVPWTDEVNMDLFPGR